MLRSGLALLAILLAAPSYAGSPQVGFQARGFHDRAFAFHRRAFVFFDPYLDGYGCGFYFDCAGSYPGYGNGGNGYGGSGRNAVVSGSGSNAPYAPPPGGYVPDPVGAAIPAATFPTTCWVRRAGYDSSGAPLGQILVDLWHPSDSMVVTRVDARFKPPNTGAGAPR